MRVTVEDTDGVRDEGSILVIEGIDIDTGEPVWFGADRRAGLDLLAAVEAEGSVEADVPAWAVLGRAVAA